MNNNKTLSLKIENLNDAQVLTLIKFFQFMERCGNIGTSRKVTFFADGDGDFHPETSFNILDENGQQDKRLIDIYKTHKFKLDKDVEKNYSENKDIVFDYDSIAWELDDVK